mmetsp:Transcript_27319/g.30535  ORF Transcript_27319/g.30535 Transcript_27319/m.30535 type:complete len:527 (-) Transcript_27319:130-1710(-)
MSSMSMSMSSSNTKQKQQQKIGILIVGLGGNNGVTLLAGQIANREKLSWESSTSTPGAGRVSAPNYNGCITQLAPRGKHGGVGYKGRYEGMELADATHAVVSGWDIRATSLGEALYESRVLDYDLVRQVREEMNTIPIMKGIYDPSFVGESQHPTATHIVTDTDEDTPGREVSFSLLAKIQYLRNDVRTFIETNNIDGHTTVIWSASVERPADVDFSSANQLLETILTPHDDATGTVADISPSMCYAVAAALEGCSFVNGGSQNTLSPGMSELFEQSYRKTNEQDLLLKKFNNIATDQPAYLLGTDFKAGQTKFKTAAVEYIRALGLTPRVIASSNHLGNNDMLNLTSKTTLEAKMRVKSNIFGPWEEEQLDHQVKVMYTPFMLDEKRDVVEYTSLGYLHSPHTMFTYTRCMDSVLCVPLMIDVAVWCDYFVTQKSRSDLVAKATAYLFKVPEGGAKNVDPGFHNQMQVLDTSLRATMMMTTNNPETHTNTNNGSDASDILTTVLQKGITAGVITEEQATILQNLK